MNVFSINFNMNDNFANRQPVSINSFLALLLERYFLKIGKRTFFKRLIWTYVKFRILF